MTWTHDFGQARALLSRDETRLFLDLMRAFGGPSRDVVEWRDIDPTRFPSALPFVWMYERVGGADGYICRLVGEVVRERWGVPMRGRTAREIAGDQADLFFIKPLDTLIDRDVIGVGVSPTGRPGTDHAERVIVPIRRGANRAVFGCSVYVPTLLFEEPPGEDAMESLTLFDRRSGDPRGVYEFQRGS